MEARNGRPRTSTARVEAMGATAVMDKLNTKGVTIAYEHPTPRDPALEWRCAGHENPDLFDPADEEALAVATEFCGGCMMRPTCLLLGLARGETGVWGGVLLEDGKVLDRVKPRGRPKKIPPTAGQAA